MLPDMAATRSEFERSLLHFVHFIEMIPHTTRSGNDRVRLAGKGLIYGLLEKTFPDR